MPKSTLLIVGEVEVLADFGRSREEMRWWARSIPNPPANSGSDPLPGATRRTAVGLILGAPLLGACAGVQQSLSQFSNPFSSSPRRGPAGPPQQPLAVGNGQVKVGLILPLSAAGNAGVAAQSMKNAAEMALAEFQNPNIQLLIKDDGGSPQGAQQGTQQALDEGAEIILGPLFALSVPATAQLARGARRLGDRVLDRFERRRPRRLSPELPAGIRRQPHHRIFRQHRQALVRGAVAGQRLWQCGGGRVQAGGGPPGRPRRRVRKIRRRPRRAGADRGAVARLRRMRCFSPTTAIRWWRWPTR